MIFLTALKILLKLISGYFVFIVFFINHYLPCSNALLESVEKEVSQMSFALRGGDVRIESQFFAKGQFLTIESLFWKRIEMSLHGLARFLSASPLFSHLFL